MERKMNILMIPTWYSPLNAEVLTAGVFHYEQSIALKKYCNMALYYPFDLDLEADFVKNEERGLLTYRSRLYPGRVWKYLRWILDFRKIKKEFIGDISMELYATNMFFRGNSPKEQVYDCCVHGSIVLRVGDKLLLDNAEGCVSASAYRFLHTLFKNHLVGEKDFLVPCCGHFMNPSEDKTSVTISGCSNGIDFNIVHEDGSIIIVTAENVEYRIPFENYKKAVISFAKQVMDFYMENPPREFEDDFEDEFDDDFFEDEDDLDLPPVSKKAEVEEDKE